MHHSISGGLAVFAAVLAWAAQAAASDLRYTYLEGGWVGVDSDASGNVSNPRNGLTGEVSTDNESGWYVGGSWAVSRRWHVFGQYQDASQDISLRGTRPSGAVSEAGNFDLIRIRAGVGYALPMGEGWDLYGRLSYDYTGVDSLGFPGLPGDDSDDHGFGAQIGARFALTRRFDVEGWLRYTSVGDPGIQRDLSFEFDDDVLGGAAARWLIGNGFVLEGGYEYGEMKTFNLGARFLL
jgi:hypothetical protein